MNRDKLYLSHILVLECIGRIEIYSMDGREEFMKNTMVQDAILRNLQILAESTTHLSDSLLLHQPQIEWKRIRGFRNIIVHDYLGIDLERVWPIIVHELPVLKDVVKDMLEGMEKGSE